MADFESEARSNFSTTHLSSAEAPKGGISARQILDHGPEGISVDGNLLDVSAWRVQPTLSPVAAAGRSLSASNAIARATELCGDRGLRHVVVGVIGPREATRGQKTLARELGRALARLKLTTVCGGKSGVMEAVCAGVNEEGGLSLGFLPGTDPGNANPHVSIPLPTGLSEGRNMVIARASRVLVAIGGSYGTLTEIAYGLHFGKRVIGLDTAPNVDGLVRAESIESAIDLTCEALIQAALDAVKHPQSVP